MPRVRRSEDSPVPIRLGPLLLAQIEEIQVARGIPTRSEAIRYILWTGIEVIDYIEREKTRANP